MWGYGMDRAGSRQGQVAGACEYGNETPGYIKCWEFLDWLQNRLASKAGLCCMERVSICGMTLRGDNQSYQRNCCLSATRFTTDLTEWPGIESGCLQDIHIGILETQTECLAYIPKYCCTMHLFQRSVASYKASSTQNANQCFIVQFAISSNSLKVNLQLLTSSSSSSRTFYHSF